MSLQLKGRLLHILPEQKGVSKAGKEWSKQDFVIETEEQFPRKVCFTLFGDKASQLQTVSEGMKIEVWFDVESREYQGRWFSNVNAWRLAPAQDEMPQQAAGGFDAGAVPPPPPPPASAAGGDENDLPF